MIQAKEIFNSTSIRPLNLCLLIFVVAVKAQSGYIAYMFKKVLFTLETS